MLFESISDKDFTGTHTDAGYLTPVKIMRVMYFGLL